MRRIRESFSIALLPALGPAGHPFGDGLTAGQWTAGAVPGDVDCGGAGAPPARSTRMM
jgi:hypothetical protein